MTTSNYLHFAIGFLLAALISRYAYMQIIEMQARELEITYERLIMERDVHNKIKQRQELCNKTLRGMGLIMEMDE